jgi:hypothetical protein
VMLGVPRHRVAFFRAALTHLSISAAIESALFWRGSSVPVEPLQFVFQQRDGRTGDLR